MSSLPAGTHIGGAQLRVADLKRSLEFYEKHLGLTVLESSLGTARLAASESGLELLRLTEHSGAQPRPRRSTGLFHLAIRFPDRTALAQTLRRLLGNGTPFQGFSDHGVSEAIYLADPDQIGLELYADRPREQWQMNDSTVAMTTLPLDVESLLDLAPERHVDPKVDSDTDLGHVHLQVSDLKEAEQFYSGELGFEVTQRSYPGALFFAAGGYHHHIGANTWAGRGAPRPSADASGLISFSIVIPAEQTENEIRFDPDGIQIEIQRIQTHESDADTPFSLRKSE